MMSDRKTNNDDVSPRRSVPPGDDTQPSILNVPNTLTEIRLVGSAILVYLVWRNEPRAFLWLFAFLLLTDWLDGKMAVLLKQKTRFGARLDSFADVAMYGAMLLGICSMKWDFIAREVVWLMAAIASYALSTVVGLIKFRRIPSYHTRAAKTCWLLVSLAVISIFTDWSVWPVRIAAIAVVLTNLETTLISLVLPRCEVDVMSIYHAVRDHTGKRPAHRDD